MAQLTFLKISEVLIRYICTTKNLTRVYVFELNMNKNPINILQAIG